jgi:hypothetical protein
MIASTIAETMKNEPRSRTRLLVKLERQTHRDNSGHLFVGTPQKYLTFDPLVVIARDTG